MKTRRSITRKDSASKRQRIGAGAQAGSLVMTVTSPCTGICKLDDVTGWCLGCGRSGAEMNGWGARSEEARQKVWNLIPDRLRHLGVSCRRLPWTTHDIRAFVQTSLASSQGTWVMGVVGADAEFAAGQGDTTQVTQVGDDVVAYTRDSALRITLNDDVRALTFDPAGMEGPMRIVLAVKRERGRLPLAAGVTNLGVDPHPVIYDRNTQLFDLGLGRKDARFCLRVAPGLAREALHAAHGLSFEQALPRIAGALKSDSPTRVIETTLGRIEVQRDSPARGSDTPDGAHPLVLPDQVATGRALPIGMDLPRAYWPGAIFYSRA